MSSVIALFDISASFTMPHGALVIEDAPELIAMQRIHQAAILQAVQDLKTLSRKPECERARADALAFFFGAGEWEGMLEEMCDMAGWDAADVRDRVRRFMNGSPVDFVKLHKAQRIKPRRPKQHGAYICAAEMVHCPA